MSLSAAFTNGVNSAFEAAGDLVKTGTLSDKSVSSYNFATGATTSTTASRSVEVIIYSANLSSEKPFTHQAVMKGYGYTLDVYDTLTVDNVVYKIVSYDDYTYLVTLNLVKER